MSEVEEIEDDIKNAFGNFRKKQICQVYRTLEAARKTCGCGHTSPIQQVTSKILWYKTMTSFYQFVLVFLVSLTIFAFYIIWAARRYNQSLVFGNGGCMATLLYTYDDCSVSC